VDARNNAVSVTLSIPPHLPQAMGDAVQVQQVVLNLIRNALEASRMAGAQEPVEVSAEVFETRVCIRVLDRGCGLPDDAEERLFQPFYSNKEEGMGIGLSLCRSLVNGQGGRLDSSGVKAVEPPSGLRCHLLMERSQSRSSEPSRCGAEASLFSNRKGMLPLVPRCHVRMAVPGRKKGFLNWTSTLAPTRGPSLSSRVARQRAFTPHAVGNGPGEAKGLGRPGMEVDRVHIPDTQPY